MGTADGSRAEANADALDTGIFAKEALSRGADVPPSLVIVAGHGRGKAFALVGRDHVIGRGRSATIALTDPRISRRHAAIRRESGGYLLLDLDSQNGVAVNGEKIAERMLRHGDELALGNTRLRFVFRVPALAGEEDATTQSRGPAEGSAEDPTAVGDVVFLGEQQDVVWPRDHLAAQPTPAATAAQPDDGVAKNMPLPSLSDLAEAKLHQEGGAPVAPVAWPTRAGRENAAAPQVTPVDPSVAPLAPSHWAVFLVALAAAAVLSVALVGLLGAAGIG